MFTKNVSLAAALAGKLIPASVLESTAMAADFPAAEDLAEKEVDQQYRLSEKWRDFWVNLDIDGAKSPVLFRVSRDLPDAIPVAGTLYSVRISEERGEAVPGKAKRSLDLIRVYVMPGPKPGEVGEDLPPLELSWVEWAQSEDGVWLRAQRETRWRWFGENRNGVMLLTPPGGGPRITVVPQDRTVLFNGPAVVRLPMPVPDGATREKYYNCVKYVFGCNGSVVEIYDRRRNQYSAWGQVEHCRKTLPNLLKGGRREYRYFVVSDDPMINPSSVRHILTEAGLREVRS